MTKPRVALMLPKAVRDSRKSALLAGEAPRDFFYGSFHLAENGYAAEIVDTRADPAGFGARTALFLEMLRNRLMGRGFSVQRVNAVADQIQAQDVVISPTDGFTVSLGLRARRWKRKPRIAAGFMGLADLVDAVPPIFRGYLRSRIRAALPQFDEIFFFSPADREQSCALYNIDRKRTSVLPFGVDTDFWSPDARAGDGRFILAVGSDLNRDYETLLRAQLDLPLKIVTQLPLRVPQDRNVEIVRGSLKGSSLTDADIRDLYRRATAVVVPLKDVFQPSGQSVTLQAMSCGAPVILTMSKGNWEPEAFVSGENCILVAPGDSVAIASAARQLTAAPAVRESIGRAARETVMQRFPVARTEHAILRMASGESPAN